MLFSDRFAPFHNLLVLIYWSYSMFCWWMSVILWFIGVIVWFIEVILYHGFIIIIGLHLLSTMRHSLFTHAISTLVHALICTRVEKWKHFQASANTQRRCTTHSLVYSTLLPWALFSKFADLLLSAFILANSPLWGCDPWHSVGNIIVKLRRNSLVGSALPYLETLRNMHTLHTLRL